MLIRDCTLGAVVLSNNSGIPVLASRPFVVVDNVGHV